jgi:hypothetical protein
LGALFRGENIHVDLLIPKSILTSTLIDTNMSNPKQMGRPPLPKGESKDTQLGVRLKPTQAEEIAVKSKVLGISPAEEVRRRIRDTSPIWVTCNWTVKELRGKKIMFSVEHAGRAFEMSGEIVTLGPKPNGEIAIKVLFLYPQGDGQVMVGERYLTQSYADELERAKEGEPFDFWISSGAFSWP